MKALLRCWFCDVTALARSWTSSDGWFQGESPADRPGRELREQEESPGAQERGSCTWRVVLNSPIWTPPTGGWSNQSVRMGRSPAHVHGF